MSNKIDLQEALKEEIITLATQSVTSYTLRKQNPIIDRFIEDYADEFGDELFNIFEKVFTSAANRILTHKLIRQILEEIKLDASEVSLVTERLQKRKESHRHKGDNT